MIQQAVAAAMRITRRTVGPQLRMAARTVFPISGPTDDTLIIFFSSFPPCDVRPERAACCSGRYAGSAAHRAERSLLGRPVTASPGIRWRCCGPMVRDAGGVP